MKIKKGLALILALVMIITLMPTMAFAKTTNSVVKTYTVATDSDMPVVAIDLRADDSTGISANNVKFRINLENAVWSTDDQPTAGNLLDTQTATATGEATNLALAFKDADSYGDAGLGFTKVDENGQETAIPVGAIDITNTVDEDFAEVTLDLSAAANNIAKNSYLRIYLALTAGGEEGEVNVNIDANDSALSGGNFTVATASDNTTTASVTGTVKSYPRQTVTGANVEIRETSVSAIGTGYQVLRLTLPSGYTWSDLSIAGDLAEENDLVEIGTNDQGEPIMESRLINLMSKDENTYKADGVTRWLVDDLDNPGTPNGAYTVVNDRTLYVRVDTDAEAGVRESMILTPTFIIERDATMGDVSLSISSYRSDVNKVANASDLVIAVYGDDTVSVTTLAEDDQPEVVAGYLEDSDADPFVVQVTLEESTTDSLVTDRYIDFDFNGEIQVADEGYPIHYYVGNGNKNYDDGAVLDPEAIDIDGIDGDRSTFTLNLSKDTDLMDEWDPDEPNRITFYVPVTAEANYTGDIELTVSGSRAGVDETTLTVGTVIAPITVETEVTDIINGAQDQAVADIVITENVPGYLNADENIVVSLDTLNLDGFAFDSADVAVTDGDLSIATKIKEGTETITIPVEDISTEISTITISDVIVNLGRNLPEGEYEISVGGNALVENSKYLNYDADEDTGDFAGATVKVPYLNITTAADTEKGVNATFTDGQASYTLNGETVEMDVAPYIDSNNRMLVPIRYAANAMGVSDDNIQWNSYTQTGTISGAMGVVRVTVGSTNLITSNGTITMDTVAVNTNNRIYVPVRYIANALGASVSWDPATRTATFTS